MPTQKTMPWSPTIYVFLTGMVLWGGILKVLHVIA